MAELNRLEPSSAWLTTKCLTSRPQLRDFRFPIGDCQLALSDRRIFVASQEQNRQLAIANRQCFWVGRRDLNPQRPQSQCGALPLSYDPRMLQATRLKNRDETFTDVVTLSIRPQSGRDDATRTRKSTERKSTRVPI